MINQKRMMVRWLLLLVLVLVPVGAWSQDAAAEPPVAAAETPAALVATPPAPAAEMTAVTDETVAGQTPADGIPPEADVPAAEAAPSDEAVTEPAPAVPTADVADNGEMTTPDPLKFMVAPAVIAQRLGTGQLAIRTVLNRPARIDVRLYSYAAEELAEKSRLDTEVKHSAQRLAIARETGRSTTEVEVLRQAGVAAQKKLQDWEVRVMQRMALDKPLQSVRREETADCTEEFRGLSSGTAYVIIVTATDESGVSINQTIQAKTHSTFKPDSPQVFLLGFIFILMIILSIEQAKGGKEFYIRRIAGLNAIDEAVGRATEMGKPVLYLTGLHDLSSIATLASISILAHVSQKTAEYETPILVPNCRSIVMVTVREVVKEAYIATGKADHFQEDNISYLTDDQFGFTSGVDGIMVREKPAANFYLGHFMAESLIYAETGHSVGAIQVAGTEEFSQIPFFITACDYTLIGEELFAAGAYLSRQPRDVGSLRGQDIGKILVIVVVIIGTLLQTAGYLSGNPSLFAFRDWFQIN